MGFWAALLHVLNFLQPALALALLMGCCKLIFRRKQMGVAGFWAFVAIIFVVSFLVLGLGIWWFGRDGKVATYACMAISAGLLSAWLKPR